MKRVIHIAPALPPVINGLGDFCKILADNLERRGYADNVFIIRNGHGQEKQANVKAFERDTFLTLLREQAADAVILHYVGYAYNRYGIPLYMARALQHYKQETGCRILVFFHELYASTNSVVKLHFYTCSLQKLMVRQLCAMADAAFTNCTPYYELLKGLSGGRMSAALCTGIFSNVPDHLYDPTQKKESRSLVVFGTRQRRLAVYGNPAFPKLLERLAIETVYDIGPGETHFHYGQLRFTAKGSLAPVALAEYLNKAKFGALSYESHLVGKSGIFSAYAAFGIIPFNLNACDGAVHEGLVRGKNYFGFPGDVDLNAFDEVAREEILRWYVARNQHAVSEKVGSYL